MTGNTADAGDNESFVARLSRLPPHADRIVFAVSSFDGSTFETVQSAHCLIVDETLGHELARYAFPAHGLHTALIMAEVTRAGGAWTMKQPIPVERLTPRPLVPATLHRPRASTHRSD